MQYPAVYYTLSLLSQQINITGEISQAAALQAIFTCNEIGPVPQYVIRSDIAALRTPEGAHGCLEWEAIWADLQQHLHLQLSHKMVL